MEVNKTYCIAEHLISIVFDSSYSKAVDLLPSFEPFLTNGSNDGSLFELHIDFNIKPFAEATLEHIGTFDIGNGGIIVDRTTKGDYQYIIKDIDGRSCCLLQTDRHFKHATCKVRGNDNMRHFGLNTAMMMMYAFRGSFYNTLLIHASVVREEGYGYAFIAQSGTGKSTHTSLWLKHIPNTDLLNDDNPIVRIINNKAYIYGSPWSGKTPCYRNIKAKLGAITQIDRAKQNSIERLSPAKAFAHILPASSTMKWDTTVFRNTYDTVIKLIETSPHNYILHCLPNEEAAIICHKQISIKEAKDIVTQ